MENISSNKISDNIKSDKENNIDNSFQVNQKVLPINISLIKNIFTIPQYKDKNIIYINDIETLNDSSLTNNIEQASVKYNQNESLTLSQSNDNQKDKSKKNINYNNYLKKELIAKENENHLLKKEIFKLKEEINLNQTKLLKLKQYEQNYDKIINDIKKEFKMKEKANNKMIEKLKNEIKTKDYILNSFQEKIILKNQMIERLKTQLKKKENQINELNRKIKKNIEINNSNSNLYIVKKSSNSKHKENQLKINSIKSKQKENSNRKSSSKNTINSKEKLQRQNKSSNNILQLNNYHSNTHRESENIYFLESLNTQKVISLKKRSKLKSPFLYKFGTKRIKNTKNDLQEDINYIKIKTNLEKKFKNNSYSDKIRENSTKINEESLNHNLKELKNIFLLKGNNSEDAFLKRYSNSNKNRYLKSNKKNPIVDNTYSYMTPVSDNKKKIYKIDIPKFKIRKNNSFNKISNNINSFNYLEQKCNIIKKKFNDEISQNMRKINGKLIFANNLQKNNTFIKKHFNKNKINFLYNISINDSNSILSNNNLTTTTIKLLENNTTKSNNITNNLFKD